MDISDYIDRPASAASSLNSQEVIDMTDPEDVLLSPEEFAQKWDNVIHKLNQPTPREGFMSAKVNLPRQYPDPDSVAGRELHNTIMRDLRARIDRWKEDQTFERTVDYTALFPPAQTTPQATMDDIDAIMRSLMPVATPATSAPSSSPVATLQLLPASRSASENTKPEPMQVSKKKPKSSNRS